MEKNLIEYEGDDYLGGELVNFWTLHQHILLKFNCYTIFKYDTYSVPDQTDGYIRWFVPAHSINAAEIRDYIERELEGEKRKAVDLGVKNGSRKIPATHVIVSINVDLFSGLDPYIERQKIKTLSRLA